MSVKTFTGSKIRRNIVGCAENCRVVVVRLGKIKCAANWVGLWVALQPFLFCEGIAKRLCRNLHCRSVYVCRLMVALSGLRVADQLYILETKLRKAIQLWSDMRNFDSFNSFCNYRCIF